MTEIKHMDIKEFQEAGYLQEANRQFFHPLGLALEVTEEETGKVYLSGVWDYRDDPEGMMFGEGHGADPGKAQRVMREWYEHAVYRQQNFGWVVQPAGESK